MKFTVVWRRAAEAALADIWTNAADRRAVSDAANRIDLALSRSPEQAGEEFYGDRLLVEPPLQVIFTVSRDDPRVEVLDVWCRERATDLP